MLEVTRITKIAMQTIDIKGLKQVRNYFGQKDKTLFEHKAYAILDRLIKSIESGKVKATK